MSCWFRNQDWLDKNFREVSSLLDGDWFWKANPEGWATGGYITDRLSGMVLYAHLSHGAGGKDQFHIYSQAPKDSRGQIPYEVSKSLPSINVSVTKMPSAIAKDIERRLLTAWVPLYTRAIARIDESNQYVETSLSIAEQIAKVVGVALHNRKPGDMHKYVSFERSPHPIFSGSTSSAEILGDSVKLRLVLAPEDALTILKLMTKS
jgi:hypothetical protein